MNLVTSDLMDMTLISGLQVSGGHEEDRRSHGHRGEGQGRPEHSEGHPQQV